MLFLACLVLSIGMATAQVTKVTGTVTSSEDGETVIGATILVKGTSVGTITDYNGKFTLSNVPAGSETLVVSYVGMQTQEVAIKPVLNIVLHSDSEMLDEVMVVAYGTSKKESFTGSAEVIKAEKLSSRPVANVTKALDGVVAGVQATSGSGQPGSGSSIIIRGFGSISASQTPLYVVDGIPYDGSISAINPNDIEAMTILKDASAGALYGSRGANGVIMITTKKGSNDGKVKVNVKANWGVASRAIEEYATLDEVGYMEAVFQSYKNKSITNDGLSPLAASYAAIEAMKSGSTAILGKNEEYNPFTVGVSDLFDPLTGKISPDAQLRYNESWMDEAMADSPLRQEYVASFTGGDDKTKYMFSLGYLDEEGLLKTTQFNRISGRANIDSEVTDWMKAGMSMNYSRNTSNSAQENNSYSSNVWYSAMLMAPIYPVYQKDADGNTVKDNLGADAFDYGSNRPAGANAEWNTIATLYDDKYDSGSDNLSGRVYTALGDLKEGALKGLKLSINYGFDLQNGTLSEYYNPYNGNSVAIKGSLYKESSRMFSYTFNQLLTWDRSFGDHTFSVLAGHEFYKYQYDELSAQKSGFPFGGLYQLDAATTIMDASSFQDNYAVQSVLSRVTYDYADKYYLSGSFRTDGSSRFYADNRWGNFWSVGGNWRISQEDFMSDVDWVNNLSVKASYGVQGNDDLGTLYAWQSFYDLGYPNASMSGALVTSLENKDLKWELSANLNVGVEARLFDRLSASIEWYQRTTDDMLLSYPMASSLGFDGYNKNVGSMINRGMDLSFGIDILKNTDLKWRMNLIGSTIQNEVVTLADKPEIISGIYIKKEGEVLNSFYTASAAGVDPATGKQLYWAWDTNEDGTKGEKYITDDQSIANQCKEIQGSRIPDFYGSIGNEFNYKGFDLSILCTYSIGGKIYDSVYRTLLYGNYIGQAKSEALERAWTTPGQITDIPRIEIGQTYIVTDNDLIDASYFTIKNISLGYTLPSKMIKNSGMSAVRISATADNVVLFSHLQGMNPQHNFSGSTDFGYVPTRTVSLGVDVTF